MYPTERSSDLGPAGSIPGDVNQDPHDHIAYLEQLLQGSLDTIAHLRIELAQSPALIDSLKSRVFELEHAT